VRQCDLFLVVADCFDHPGHLSETRKILMLSHAARRVDAYEWKFLTDREIGGGLKLFSRHDAK
jgi:hypothetical protein